MSFVEVCHCTSTFYNFTFTECMISLRQSNQYLFSYTACNGVIQMFYVYYNHKFNIIFCSYLVLCYLLFKFVMLIHLGVVSLHY